MIEHPPHIRSNVVQKLLNDAFDDQELTDLCLHHYRLVYDKFSVGMGKDTKISYLMRFCIQTPERLKNLIRIIREQAEDIFQKYESELYSPAREEISLEVDAPLGRERVDVLIELSEWKTIHNSVQVLISDLEAPLNYLNLYRFDPNNQVITEAGIAWQRQCVPKLKNIFEHWSQERVNLSIFLSLQDKVVTSDAMTRQIMGNIDHESFMEIYLWFVELKDILWNILTIADKKILVIIDNMKQ